MLPLNSHDFPPSNTPLFRLIRVRVYFNINVVNSTRPQLIFAKCIKYSMDINESWTLPPKEATPKMPGRVTACEAD